MPRGRPRKSASAAADSVSGSVSASLSLTPSSSRRRPRQQYDDDDGDSDADGSNKLRDEFDYASDSGASVASSVELVGGASGRKGRGRRRTTASESGSGRGKGRGGSGRGRPRKLQRTLSDDNGGEGSDNAVREQSASSLINELHSRHIDEDVEADQLSRLSRAASSTRLTYFDQLLAPAPKSKNTLKNVPKLSEEQRASIAAALPVRHAVAKHRLLTHHRSCMREWLLQLHAGYNLLAYGYGSKKSLLNEFARVWLTDGPVIVVNGYYPSTHAKHLLNLITRDLMQLPSLTFRDLQTHVDFIRQWFNKDEKREKAAAEGRRARRAARHGGLFAEWNRDQNHDSDSSDDDDPAASLSSSSSSLLPRVYIVVHNIDGASLRTSAQQHVLASLASIPQIHLIASLDHALSGWLWEQSLIAMFNFVHHDCTTYAEYKVELEYARGSNAAGGAGTAGDGLLESSATGRAAGIANVLASLTPNHRKVLDLLARAQLQPNNPHLLPGTGRYLHRGAMLDACEESMLVSSAANFDRLMSELRDHSLIEEKIINRCKAITIPYSEPIIRRYILGEKQEEEAAVAEAATAAAQANQNSQMDGDAFQLAIGMGDDGEEEEELDEQQEADSD